MFSTELSKEVLAPVDGIREDLVATAVKFLQNPKVQQSALSQKKAFLQRKGLTTEEIETAVKRAGAHQSNVTTAVQGTSSNKGSVGTQQQALVPHAPVPVVVSQWIKARDILAVVTMVTGVSYAAYRLYKDFLYPWLFGVETSDKRLDKLEKIVAESFTTLRSIDETLGKQQEKLQMLSHDVNSKMGGDGGGSHNKASISELKTELSSIKGLLLNRRQFPAMPSTTPVLPSWQLASNSGDADSNNKGTSDSTSTVPKITFSSSPAPEGSTLEGSASVTSKNSNTDADLTVTDADLTVNDKDDTEMSLLENDSDVSAKNRNLNENETDRVENEADMEEDGLRSEPLVTKEKEDSEGNESLD